MALTRRDMLASAALAGAMGPALAQGDAYPVRPITAVIAYPAGGVTDVSARVVAEAMGRVLGVNLVVENRPGGTTSVASGGVMRAEPNGYTILFGTSSLAINNTLQPRLPPMDPFRDLRPVRLLMHTPFLLHAHPSVPAKNVAELVAYAKANPNAISVGSSGVGAVNHLAWELLKQRTGMPGVHVPYRGGSPLLIDLTSGRIQIAFSALFEAMPPVEAGQTKAIAVSSLKRMPFLPNVPAVSETAGLEDFDAIFWQGMFVPPQTPDAIVARIADAAEKATADAAVLERFKTMGIAAVPGDAAALTAHLKAEITRWRDVIQKADIKVE